MPPLDGAVPPWALAHFLHVDEAMTAGSRRFHEEYRKTHGGWVASVSPDVLAVWPSAVVWRTLMTNCRGCQDD